MVDYEDKTEKRGTTKYDHIPITAKNSLTYLSNKIPITDSAIDSTTIPRFYQLGIIQLTNLDFPRLKGKKDSYHQ